MTYRYEIAGVPISFRSPFRIADGKYDGSFRKEGTVSDIFCPITLTDAFSAPKGKKIFSGYLSNLFVDRETVTNDQTESPEGRVVFRSVYRTDGSHMIPVTADRGAAERMTLDRLWSAVDLPFQLSFRSVVTLHSASVDIGGKALLFCAPSGTGKSTQAGLWEKHRGAVILNGDKNALGFCRSVPFAFGLPFCGSSGICRNYALPIAAIVVLSQSGRNEITRLDIPRAVASVTENCVGHNVIPGTAFRTANTVFDLAAKVPVYHLACTPDEDAVRVLEGVLP